MSMMRRSINYGNQIIEFAVVRRARKTLEIAVEPDASVVVAAPLSATLEAIDQKVRKRAAWVRRKQRYFSQFLPRTVRRRYVPGETHLYLGRQYRLRVRKGEESRVKLTRGFLLVQSQRPGCSETTRRLLMDWYSIHAERKFEERLALCLARFPDPTEFLPSKLVIREMKKRWGSMSPSGRLQLSARLIQAPTDGIDYVITHELCHIAEPYHGAEFFDLLGRVMPDWEKRKMRLEKMLA